VPETSSSIGLLEIKGDKLVGVCMVRSPFNAAQERIARRIINEFEVLGGSAKIVSYIGG
jgi:hypothetical protein